MCFVVKQNQQQEKEYCWQFQWRTKSVKYNVHHSLFSMLIRSWHSALWCAWLTLFKMLPKLFLWELSSSLVTNLIHMILVYTDWKWVLQKFLMGPAPLYVPTRWRRDKWICFQGHHCVKHFFGSLKQMPGYAFNKCSLLLNISSGVNGSLELCNYNQV